MTDLEILNNWKIGYSIEHISKEYKKELKRKGIYITLYDSRKYIEPIIFNYQFNLFKGDIL